MDYYDSDEDRYNEEPECNHDEREPFDKLAKLVYKTPHLSTSIAPAPQQHRPIVKTPLDSYMSDSDDSYTEEEMLDYAERGNYFDAVLLEKKEMGDTDACYKIGATYVTGGLSMHKAMLWYDRAAKKGHVKAQTTLGNIYMDALKTRSPYSRQYQVMFDEEKALKWCQKAFKNGNMDAAFNIGNIYRVSENPNQNNAQKAMAFRIAKYYEDHYGRNNKRTVKWYHKAGLHNHRDARNVILDRDYELSTELKREVIYEHYTHELHSDIEKQAKQIKSLEEQLEAKDYMIAALQKILTDGNVGGTETENAMESYPWYQR